MILPDISTTSGFTAGKPSLMPRSINFIQVVIIIWMLAAAFWQMVRQLSSKLLDLRPLIVLVLREL